MRTQGRITQVYSDPAGSGFAQNSPIGETLLYVTTATDFGVTELLSIDDNIYTVVDKSEFVDFDTVTVDPPLITAVDEESFAYFYPPADNLIAEVQTLDDNDSEEANLGQTIPSIVKHNLKGKILEGDYTDGSGAWVWIDNESGAWRVEELSGEPSVLDLSEGVGTLPVETLPPGIPITDGSPPAGPPAVEVINGINCVMFRITPPGNDDPIVEYSVYSEGILITSNRATIISVTVDMLAMPYDSDTSFTVSAWDADGEGPQSVAVSGRPIEMPSTIPQEIYDSIALAGQKADDAQADADAADAKAIAAALAADAAQGTGDDALTAAATAQAAADGAIRTYYSPEPPWPDNSSQPDDVLGDLWYDDDNDIAHRWNGTIWKVIQDDAIAVALAAAAAAQAVADAAQADATTALTTANGKNTNTFSASALAPSTTDRVEGDIHWQIVAQEVITQWRLTSGAWVETTISGATLTNLDAASITTGFLNVALLIQAGAIVTAHLGANQVTAEKVAADVMVVNEFFSREAYLGYLEVNKILSGEWTADVAMVNGSFIVGDSSGFHIEILPDRGIALYAADGITPIVDLRIDGQPSIFRGKVIADDVSILNGLIMQGLLSTVATNSRLTLQDSVPDPTAPTLSVGTAPQPWAAHSTSYYSERGIFWSAAENCWWQLLYSWAGKSVHIRSISITGVAGTLYQMKSSGGTSNSIWYEASGLVKVGSRVWLWVKDDWSDWVLKRCSFGADFREVLSQEERVPSGGDSTYFPSLGYDGSTYLYGTEYNDVIWQLTQATSTSDGFGFSTRTPIVLSGWSWPSLPSHRILYVGQGNFDYGSNRVVIITSTAIYTYTKSGTALTLESTVPTDGAAYGAGWNGSNFFTIHNISTILKRYSSWKSASTDSRWWIQVAESIITPSTKETGPSPAASVVLPDRRYLTIAAPNRSSQTTHTSFYSGYSAEGGTQPARTAMWRQGASQTSLSKTIESKVLSGTNPKAASDFADASGDPGEIVAQSGGFEVRGDSSGNWPIVAPVGSMVHWTNKANIPDGWLECNGVSATQTNYPLLAEAMGKTGTFALPDRLIMDEKTGLVLVDMAGAHTRNTVISFGYTFSTVPYVDTQILPSTAAAWRGWSSVPVARSATGATVQTTKDGAMIISSGSVYFMWKATAVSDTECYIIRAL